MYAQSKDRHAQSNYAYLETLSIQDLVKVFCSEPDESLITQEEVRPFLNAVFLMCRIMQKVIPYSGILPSSMPADRAFYLVQCLSRYDWLLKIAPRLCEKRELDLMSIFPEEIQICREMVNLLPSKIDRMCYLGESGLSL